MPTEFAIIAPAKINLSLAVLGVRLDGYHEIESWVVPIDWADELVFSTNPDRFDFIVEGGGDCTPGDESNLVCLAAAALARELGLPRTGTIRLRKELPVGAGLGGGSSDAAAALVGLNRLWGANLPKSRLAEIGGALGSDVPLFLDGGPVLLRGRGERVEAIQESWAGWIVVVAPAFGSPTAQTYQRWRETSVSTRGRRPWLRHGVGAMQLMGELFNDLEHAAFAMQPPLGEFHALLEGALGRPFRMTGSGSGLFTLADSADEAESWGRLAAQRLTGQGQVRVVRVREAPTTEPPLAGCKQG